jgi:hypothetical protein
MQSESLPIVCIYFRIYGDSFDPDEVTQHLHIEPTSYFRAGDPMPPGKGHRQHDGWMVKIGPRKTLETKSMLRELRENIDAPATVIRQACSELNVEAVITCTIEPTSLITPALQFPLGFVEWVADIGASIDVDVMLWATDSPDVGVTKE